MSKRLFRYKNMWCRDTKMWDEIEAVKSTDIKEPLQKKKDTNKSLKKRQYKKKKASKSKKKMEKQVTDDSKDEKGGEEKEEEEVITICQFCGYDGKDGLLLMDICDTCDKYFCLVCVEDAPLRYECDENDLAYHHFCSYKCCNTWIHRFTFPCDGGCIRLLERHKQTCRFWGHWLPEFNY